ncbi:hypothetical protein CBP51_15485 [Cellvibrio mixtus]|uniref:HDOD domain-containing protein n=1 Tax=Cellvibrio mixtus TaxID=39650 RepID=A0A266Q4M6_9GAMM|nr:hypothetical protein CBP51_15485 [Cellvibrio mixtus]
MVLPELCIFPKYNYPNWFLLRNLPECAIYTSLSPGYPSSNPRYLFLILWFVVAIRQRFAIPNRGRTFLLQLATFGQGLNISEGIVDLKDLVDNAQKLPNIPKVVQELIESFGDENVNNEEIAKKISADQVLTAKVLRAANTAHYGGNRKVGSVSDAVFMLGFNAVRTLVLASGMVGAFKAPEGFDLPAFWHNSFAVASTCKWLARFSRDDAETAFTCGMIHNIGELLIHILLPEECKEIQKVVDRGARNPDIEKNVLGFNFPEAGAELANRWKFPDAIVAGIRYQLNPQAAPQFSRLAALVYIADYIVHSNEKENSAHLIENFPNELATQLGINLVKLLERIDETKDLIGGYDELLH